MKSKDYYNEISKGYNELYGEEQLKKWNIVKKITSFSKDDIVLDLGCGTGIILQELSKMVKQIIGIDNAIRMLTKAPKLDNVSYFLTNAENIPFPDKYFDKTISLTMLQDVKNWDDVFKEIKRVTKGEIVITLLKRNKDLETIKKRLKKYFTIKKYIEEEKDFIFLLE